MSIYRQRVQLASLSGTYYQIQQTTLIRPNIPENIALSAITNKLKIRIRRHVTVFSRWFYFQYVLKDFVHDYVLLLKWRRRYF